MSEVTVAHPTDTEEEVHMITLNVNGKSHEIDISPEMPLLWAIRDKLNLTGTKFGCGVAQ